MNNREAIKWLKAWSATHQSENVNIREAVWNAIQAIKELERRDKYFISVKEELEQYRELGTVEDYRQNKLMYDLMKEFVDKDITDLYDELYQYKSIGTLEQVRKAVERMKPKKPILCMNEVSGMFVDYADGRGEYKTQMNNWWRCPCCNSVVGQKGYSA